MVGFQPLGRLEYQLDWIDGGLEFTDKGLVFWPPCPLWTRGAFYLKVQYVWIGKAFEPARFVIRHPLTSFIIAYNRHKTKVKVKQEN